MIRTLTLLFVLLAGAVVWFRFQPDNPDGQIGTAVKQDPSRERPPQTEHPVLPSRSMGRGLPDKGEWRGKPVFRDLNGDGKTDLVASIRRFDKHKIADGMHVWLGDGTGGWTPCDKGLPTDMGYGGTDAGDVNGDGRPDLVYSGHDTPPRVFLNFLNFEGQNEWVALQSMADLNGTSCSDVALGDFDRDGFADLAIMGFFPDTGGLYVLAGVGTGEWKPKHQLMPKHDYGAIVRFVDLDGDGRVELIAATSAGPKVWGFVDGAWVDQSEGLPTTAGEGEISGIVRGIAAKDLDGDGLAELVVAGLPNGVHSPVRLFRRVAGQWALWGSGLPSGESCFDVVFAQLGQEGTGLFLAGQHGVLVVRCGRDGACAVLGRIAGTEGVLNVGAGDVDGNGTDEVLVIGQRGLQLYAFDESGSPAKEGVVR